MKTVVSYKDKEYFYENDRWWGINVNGVRYRVLSKDLITNLYNISKEEESVLNEPIIVLDEVNEVNEEVNDASLEQDLPSAGLGDSIAKLTTALGIVPCQGCNKRKALLNKVFPWLKQKRDFTEQEIFFLQDLGRRTTMTSEESKELFRIYNEVTGSRVQQCACPGVIRNMITRLNGFLT